jgi:bisphosphoglycerate-independent phosphoglycerate mutase (AlkP superfamily)
MTFRTVDDLLQGNAVYQDFTNRVLIERGETVSERTATEAASILARIASQHRFTLYEYFITDKIGHAQDMAAAKTILPKLASFIRKFLNELDLDRTTVILTSDHGNIEDLSTRNHTLHQVPTIVWGARRQQVADRIKTLVDITPAIVDLLTETTTN